MPNAPLRVIDSAALALVLRQKFYGPVSSKPPDCDRCGAKQSGHVTVGALNYCDDCWDRLGAKYAALAGERKPQLYCIPCDSNVAPDHACEDRT